MATTFADILDQLERASLDSVEKGRRFERLMASYLMLDPFFEYDEVWLWSDYPDRGKRADTGVDLVARHRETGELTAIQCKFYASTTHISKAAVDSFLAASSKSEFSDRLIITTTDSWGKNALEALDDQSPPVGLLRAKDLDDSPIDWSRFSLEQPEMLAKLPPHELRLHQEEAVTDVLKGFKTEDRGKLIMACGTGKTFTSLKLAERMVPEGGAVLFLVPSIALLSQTLREWTAQCQRHLDSFAVCSDPSAGKRKRSEDMSAKDLAHPATTDPTKLVSRFSKRSADGMAVVFSTYQSIEVIAAAQGAGLPEFDLVVCDEAHRTTGVTLADEDDSAFVRVHDQDHLKGRKRLYMTATPRVFGDAAQSKARSVGAVLADMGDEARFGPEFHRLGFAKAVDLKILTDYKVLVLAVDEGHVSRNFQNLLASTDQTLQLEDAAKLVGCWNGLAKRANDEEEFEADPEPMKRAVAFAGNIKTSKTVADSFRDVADREFAGIDDSDERYLRCEVRHVDGTQSMLKRNEELDWLRKEPEPGECRILSNAKCLSEGVDVPALDAVLFLSPRKSQVDVVQSVGRVMRKLEGKRYGYVILPIAVPAETDPEQALADNEKYKVVWQVLQALRSHDERMNAVVNTLDLNKGDTRGRLSLIGVGGESEDEDDSEAASRKGQLSIPFPNLDQWRDAILARIVKRVGDRQYWDDWAKDIAKIAQALITRITALVNGSDQELRQEFDAFLEGLKDNLNPELTADDAIEMLAQHMITGPVFDSLFKDYNFSERNPVSVVMQRMIERLQPKKLESERDELEDFYESVRRRASELNDPAARQEVIKDLYESFFRHAFPEASDRLGIVYTPIEIVDFILRSTDEALREHFDLGLEDKGVHILDPFTGTGSFIVRMIQSGLISPESLEHKYRYELHANEIVLLAYYVAAVNIEEAYHAVQGGGYVPFEGIVLTDTFQMREEDDRDEFEGMEKFPENNERVKRQKEADIRVIIGNPPYSIGQGSGNDDNQNLKYPSLDGRIEETYAARSSALLKKSLHDSYIRAIRWATDRIGDRGVICFVTNGGFIDSNSADGLRKCVAEEFSQVAIVNLRGNQNTAGELSRKEGGKVFGSGSRATIAITLFVKNSDARGEHARLLYHDIGDYLSREKKLETILTAGSMSGLKLEHVTPNAEGDWLNQRDASFSSYPSIGSKRGLEKTFSIFKTYSAGLKSNRDAWVYSFSRTAVETNVSRMIETYNAQVDALREADPAPTTVTDLRKIVDRDPRKISWDGTAEADALRGKTFTYSPQALRMSTYRPFTRKWVYLNRELNNSVYQLEGCFPTPSSDNIGFYINGYHAHSEFALLAVDEVPCLDLFGKGGQYFPLYTYIDQDNAENLMDLAGGMDGERYIRNDNVTDNALDEYQEAFGDEITKDDIFFYVYGLLHSPAYRERFKADLKKALPRIPKVEAFREFAEAGRRLAELHLGYETIEPYPLAVEEPTDPDFRVSKMRFAGSGKKKDRSTIIYNDQVKVSGIPDEAYRYMLGSRSGIEWIMDRYQVKTDKKSGIVNDPNDWAAELGEPRYILDLLSRIVRVSVETISIVDSLPELEIVETLPRTQVRPS